MRRALACLAIAFFLSACSTQKTLEDFQNMSPDEVADFVCGNTAFATVKKDEISSLTEQNRALRRNIDELQLVLAKGYRIHEDCQKTYRTISECSDNGNGNFVFSKRRDPYDQGTTTCREIPVSINPEYEERKISERKVLLREQESSVRERESELSDFMRHCGSEAYKLTPEEAFQHYQSGTAPQPTV